MGRVAMDRVVLALAPISGEIMLARFGKKPMLALDKRVATVEALGVVTEYMMRDAPKGSSVDVWVNGKKHTLTVVPTRGRKRDKEKKKV